MDDDQTDYHGAETTGFQSPARDYIEHVIDLARVLDLSKPGIYPVRVAGQAFAERGIRDGDILIANTAPIRRTAGRGCGAAGGASPGDARTSAGNMVSAAWRE